MTAVQRFFATVALSIAWACAAVWFLTAVTGCASTPKVTPEPVERPPVLRIFKHHCDSRGGVDGLVIGALPRAA